MDPAMAYAMHHPHQQFYGPSSPYQPEPIEASTSTTAATETTPFKYDPESSNTMSPYWSHLDQATLAMGLATPAKVSPSTPRRRQNAKPQQQQPREGEDDDEYPVFNTAQAPLIRQQYYGYDAVPPSPATQFMMSPQASFAYNYGYGYSPTRARRSAGRTKFTATNSNNLPTPLKLVEQRQMSSSPTHTIETATETESLEQSSTTAA
jgi:hypothetical protein